MTDAKPLDIADLIKTAELLVQDPEIRRLKLDTFVATMVAVIAGFAFNEIRTAARIRELEHRVRFLGSCLMAGDRLVPSGRLLTGGSLEVLEQWMLDEARALAQRSKIDTQQ